MRWLPYALLTAAVVAAYVVYMALVGHEMPGMLKLSTTLTFAQLVLVGSVLIASLRRRRRIRSGVPEPVVDPVLPRRISHDPDDWKDATTHQRMRALAVGSWGVVLAVSASTYLGPDWPGPSWTPLLLVPVGLLVFLVLRHLVVSRDSAFRTTGGPRGRQAPEAEARDDVGGPRDVVAGLCLLPDRPLTPLATELRDSWADRWGDGPPFAGGLHGDNRFAHAHAYPDFRCPLSADEMPHAQLRFLTEVVRRIAGRRDVLLVHTDWVFEDGRPVDETAPAPGHPWLWFVDDVDNPDPLEEMIIARSSVIRVPAASERVRSAVAAAAEGVSALVLVDPDHGWLLHAKAECAQLSTTDAALAAALATAETESWLRWRIPRRRRPLIDLRAVEALVERRNEAWAAAGVRLPRAPRSRTWDPGTDYRGAPGQPGGVSTADGLPDDLERTDGLSVALESDVAQAHVFVSDVGDWSVHVLHEDERVDWSEYPQGAGTYDVDDVDRLLDRVTATLTHRRVPITP